MRKIPKKGIITIAFDDGYLDTYKYAINYLNALNIKSTVAIPVSLIGKKYNGKSLMGLKQLKNLVRLDHEIASHGFTHNDMLQLKLKDKKLPVFEIAQSKRELNNILNCKVDSFVFPFLNESQVNSLRVETASYYGSARAASLYPYYNKIPINTNKSIVGFVVTDKHSVYYLNKQIDIAEEKRFWLIEVFHLIGKNVCIANPFKYFMHIADFKKHINYILSKDVDILTQREVVGSAQQKSKRDCECCCRRVRRKRRSNKK